MPALTLKLATRASLLAKTQSRLVADALERLHPGMRVELVLLQTTGDQIADRPLHEAGGKGLFTRELELALLNGTVDFAVHSFKDVPVTMPLVETSDLTFAAVPQREDPRDVLILPRPFPPSPLHPFDLLPKGARIGTGSLRRQAQLLSARPDLRIWLIRGNIDTRIKKLDEGQFDAILLALAGLKRAGLFDSSRMIPLDPDLLLPAAGQGALAVQCRRSDERTVSLLSPLDHPPTRSTIDLERALVHALQGDCSSPIAALATHDGDRIRLRAAIGKKGGHPPLLRAEATASATSAIDCLHLVLDTLSAHDVHAHLHGE